jgi:two-component system LytT family response regulator
MPIEALIVDDERLARQRLRRLLDTEPDVAVVGECASGREAVEFLERQPADLIFLDIQMPEMDGFAVVEQIVKDRQVMVVFVTAHAGHAVRAFDVNATDYLLKPFDRERLERCLERVRAQREALGPDAGPGRPRPHRLAVRSAGKVFFVKMDDIDWVEAADNYIVLHVKNETHILRETMNSIQTRLDPRKFVRVHRSRIVNIERIKQLEPSAHGEYAIALHDGTRLTLSRSYREKLMEAMSG